jgi:hypothetical protein
MKTCSKCKQEKLLDRFSRSKRHSDGCMAWCKDCCAEYQKNYRPVYYAANKENCDNNTKHSNRRLRAEIIDGLGAVCSCCGETRRNFLSLEHINGGGHKHRQSHKYNQRSLYKEIIREGFPRDKYTLLCFNCNCSRGFFGYCCNPPTEQVKQSH